jgi:uncharacterized membrane protein
MTSNKILKSRLDGIYNLLKESYSGSPFLSSVIAGSLAALGLATDSTSTVLGSMLISPIGTFIIQANLQSFLKQYNYRIKDLQYSPWYIPLLLVMISTISLSYLIGKLFIHLNNPFTGEPLNKNWPTHEMMARADPMSALYTIPVALLCGIILPLIVVNSNSVGFVAIGIATSLIPPLANIGLSLNFKYNPVVHEPELKYYKRNAVLTGFSIFLINIILLLIPSRILKTSLLTKTNIFDKIEDLFNF